VRPRTALVALAAPALLALSLPTGLRAEPDPPASPKPEPPKPLAATDGIPVGIPITLDGVFTPAEWEDAAKAVFSPAGPRLHVKQCRGTLLLAVESNRPWPQGGRFDFYTHPGVGDGTADDPGALQLDFEPFQHDRPHALTTERPAGAATVVRKDGVWVVRATAHGERASLEAAAPLAALGITGKEPPPLKWLAAWIVLGSADSARTVPAGIDLRGPTGKPPPGLASTAGWATASTWVDPDGAGAFRKTEWTAFLSADRELADRGERAHALAASLLDATRGEEPKVDGHLEREILESLRFVATKEPWTRADVRTFAIGLWRLNRLDEAIATLGDAGSVAHPAADRGLDLYVLALVAKDAERYLASATAWDRLADSLGSESLAAPHRAQAAHARELQPLLDAERAARAADAAKDDQPLVRLRTSRGDVYLRCLEDVAPESVAQFVALCDEKTKDGKPFFSDLLWHRVVANGVAQTGDPTSREGCAAAGAGGSPWYVDPEKPETPRPFFRGSVGFAMDRMNRVRSQFFVVTARKESFDKGGYPCFATVIAGMDVVDRLEACDTLIGAEVLRRRPHAYEPKKK
jgi:cyclophilin family peptidyl-prolyl cis-trans isomerase